MTAPQGFRVISIGQLGTPDALGMEIFVRSRDGNFPAVQVEPELPPVNSLVDCRTQSAGCTLPATVRSAAQAAGEATANAAHALTATMSNAQDAAVFETATAVYREMWSRGDLLANPAPEHAAAISRCHDAFEAAATRALQDAEAANPLATALTWALLGRDGERFVAIAEQLQASATLEPEVKADLASAIGLMRQ